jgi:hypothetical protein
MQQENGGGEELYFFGKNHHKVQDGKSTLRNYHPNKLNLLFFV